MLANVLDKTSQPIGATEQFMGAPSNIVQGIRQATDLASTLGSCHMIGVTNQALAASLLAGDDLGTNFIFSFAVVATQASITGIKGIYIVRLKLEI